MLAAFQNKLHETTGRTIHALATLFISFVSFFAVAAHLINLTA